LFGSVLNILSNSQALELTGGDIPRKIHLEIIQEKVVSKVFRQQILEEKSVSLGWKHKIKIFGYCQKKYSKDFMGA
jgi:hypothetical protein